MGFALGSLSCGHGDIASFQSDDGHILIILSVSDFGDPDLLVGAKGIAGMLFKCCFKCRSLGSGQGGSMARVRHTGSNFCIPVVAVFH